MSEESISEIFLFDPEIERTFRKNRRKQRAKKMVEEIPEPIVEEPVDERDRIIRTYTAPRFLEFDPGVARPEVQAQHFELKPMMFQMLQSLGQFGGQATEDPHLHLKSFLEICDNFKLQGVTPPKP